MNILKRAHQENIYTDDEQRSVSEEIQDLTNVIIKEIDTLTSIKEEEIKKV